MGAGRLQPSGGGPAARARVGARTGSGRAAQADLRRPDVQAQLVARVTERQTPAQGVLPATYEPVDIARVVAETAALYIRQTIDVPRIVVMPVGDVTAGYRGFDLDVRAIRLQPVAREILVEHLQSHQRERLEAGASSVPERRPEDYLVRRLMDFDDVSYDEHADLLYMLAGQAVAHLRTYLKDEEEILNVLQFHQKTLADLIHAQMEQHYEEHATAYEAAVSRGFTALRPANFTLPAGETIRDFRVLSFCDYPTRGVSDPLGGARTGDSGASDQFRFGPDRPPSPRASVGRWAGIGGASPTAANPLEIPRQGKNACGARMAIDVDKLKNTVAPAGSLRMTGHARRLAFAQTMWRTHSDQRRKRS